MVRLSFVTAMTLACALALGPTARAGSWPTPAAGPSASGAPEVLFTFDDGPSPATTREVLDILAARRIQAIFFLVGQRIDKGGERARELVDRMLREGHIVANHSMSHPNLCKGKDDAAAAEVLDTRAILERVTGMPVTWFRAPYGVWCARLAKFVEDQGLRHFYWDIDPQEWKTNSGPITEQRVVADLRRLKGRAVVLLHDTKPATVKALPKILDWIDAENARRAKAGQPAIRIVGAHQVAIEQLGADAVDEAGALADDLLRVLASGLASAVP